MSLYLGIRTDASLAEFYLYRDDTEVAEKTWQADRQLAHGLLAELEKFLMAHGVAFADLSGLFIHKGPGSFTGLRIGITTMNTMAYSLRVPIVGSDGDAWQQDAVGRLTQGDTDELVLPHYGAEARITRPKK